MKFSELGPGLSHGSITITAGPEPDASRPDTSAEAIAMAQDGEAGLAIVSARTFDTLGVTSFQALQTPYLITTNELADKVLADPITDTMLEGTKSLGLVGLGLAYDFLAYPGGYGEPVLTPDDYAGKAFQVRPSRANDLLVQALGGTSDPRNGQDLERAVANEEVRGNWEKFDRRSEPVIGEIFTANEPVFLRATVIVMNDKVFSGLSPNQQQAMRDAAAQTRDWMASLHRNPVVLAAAYCSDFDGSIAIATPDQLAAMKAATAPVVAALEQDETNRLVIARIRELAQGTPRPPWRRTPARRAAETLPIPTLSARGDQTAIDGLWRLEVDPQVLLDQGQSQTDASNNGGAWTWNIKNGVVNYKEPGDRECRITYVLNGKKFLGIGFDPGCDNVWPLEVERQGNTLVVKPWPGTTTGQPLTGGDEGRMTPDPYGFAAAFFHNPMVWLGEAS